MSLPRYAKYKASGVEWIGQLPAHWKVVPLKRNAHLITERATSKHRAIALENVEGWSGRYLETGGEFEGDGVSFQPGDLLFGKLRPYLAKVFLADFSGEAVGDFHVLRPEKGLVPRFAQYQMLQREFISIVDGSTFGSKMPRASWEAVGEMPFVVPPDEEQRGIASFLDHETAKIDALIAEQEKLLALLAEKRQATISHAVTRGLDPNAPMKDSGIPWLGEVPAHWEVLPIKRLSPVQRGASPRPIDDPRYFDEDGEYSWVRISDVTASDGVLRSTEQRLSELGASLSVPLQPGVLFVSIAASVGKPCITAIKACIHDGFVYFPRLSIAPMFLFRVFEAGQCFAGLGKMGTQLNLNTETIGAIEVGLPPPAEMGAILKALADELSQIDGLQDAARDTLELLQERRSALIAAAVTGQIDVRGAVESHAA